MGFSPPVPQQDSNWEIRLAVLISLLLQVLLIFVAPVRRRSSSSVPRFIVWSCYLLADWVADLALGLLLNNMGNIGGNGGSGGSSSFVYHVTAEGAIIPAGNTAGSPIIFAFWAPFLLVHLGGQDTITAYSIQDNDLWLRHLIGLLFELFSACVIFFCSLGGNPMIHATVLIFVAGIIKYGERTYSLYSGSADGVLAEIIGEPDPGPNYAKLMTLFDSKKKAGLDVEIVVTNPRQGQQANSLQEQWKEKRSSLETQAYKFFRIFRRLCFDVNLSYEERKISHAYFLERVNRSATEAFEVIEVELNFIYDMVHTKEPIVHTKAGCLLRFVASACIVSALLIFFFHHNDGIAHVDIAITYVLLIGGMTLEAAALARLLVSNWTLAFLEESPRLARLVPVVRSLRTRSGAGGKTPRS